jgi:small-conductance mechanosensitive channel
VVVGISLLLENLGISVTAIWTTLGVGSVAVALALQDTLSNLFGGVYLRLDQPVRMGDYVKLGSGEEGVITQMGWRSTRIRTIGNNVVIIPNAKLATQVLTNFTLPVPEMSLNIPVTVSYESDPDEVERALLEEASRDIDAVPGLRATPPPFVRLLPGFGETGLTFTLTVRIANFADQFLVQHHLRKRVLARFRRDGIEIPFAHHQLRVVRESQAGKSPGHSPDQDSE